MSKQETIIAALESMMLDHAVLAELKHHSVNDEDSAKKFILSVNRALCQHTQQVFNDWGYFDPVGMSVLFTSSVVIGIDLCFPTDKHDWAAQTVGWVMMWITAVLLAGFGVNLHSFHRDLTRKKIAAIHAHLLDFDTSSRMRLWQGLQAQQDIVQRLTAWEFNNETIMLLKDDWMEITSKPRRNVAKMADFLKRIQAHRREFEFYMRTKGQSVSRRFYFLAGLIILGGTVLLNQMNRRGGTGDNLILMGIFAFFYRNVRHYAWQAGSHSLAAWDIQEIERLLAVLSPEDRQREEKKPDLPAVTVTTGKSKPAVFQRHSGRRGVTKKRVAKTRTFTTKLKWTLSQLCYAAASLSVSGYQLMMGVLQSASQRIAAPLAAVTAFQKTQVAEKNPVQPQGDVHKKLVEPPRRRKIKKTKPTTEITPLLPPPSQSTPCKHELVIEKTMNDPGESAVISAPVLPDLEEKPPAPETLLQQDSQTPAETTQPPMFFPLAEEKEALLQRVQCAEEAARLHYSWAVGAGDHIKNLQAQLAQATQAVYYWQWQAASLWQRLVSPPVQGSDFKNMDCSIISEKKSKSVEMVFSGDIGKLHLPATQVAKQLTVSSIEKIMRSIERELTQATGQHYDFSNPQGLEHIYLTKGIELSHIIRTTYRLIRTRVHGGLIRSVILGKKINDLDMELIVPQNYCDIVKLFESMQQRKLIAGYQKSTKIAKEMYIVEFRNSLVDIVVYHHTGEEEHYRGYNCDHFSLEICPDMLEAKLNAPGKSRRFLTAIKQRKTPLIEASIDSHDAWLLTDLMIQSSIIPMIQFVFPAYQRQEILKTITALIQSPQGVSQKTSTQLSDFILTLVGHIQDPELTLHLLIRWRETGCHISPELNAIACHLIPHIFHTAVTARQLQEEKSTSLRRENLFFYFKKYVVKTYSRFGSLLPTDLTVFKAMMLAGLERNKTEKEQIDRLFSEASADFDTINDYLCKHFTLLQESKNVCVIVDAWLTAITSIHTSPMHFDFCKKLRENSALLGYTLNMDHLYQNRLIPALSDPDEESQHFRCHLLPPPTSTSAYQKKGTLSSQTNFHFGK